MRKRSPVVKAGSNICDPEFKQPRFEDEVGLPKSKEEVLGTRSEFKSRSDHQLDLFQVVPGSTPLLRLYIANWSALCQLGFLLF